jgi:hypothetical protein
MEIILQRTIKKIPILKKIITEKKIDDMNMLTTLKKHSYLKKCGILKFYKFNECFNITSKFQSFKSPLPCINLL